MGKKITLLHTHNTIELYSTLYPFLVSKISRLINFQYFPKFNFSANTRDVLFTRIFKKRFNDHHFVKNTLNQLQDQFQAIHFLDDSDGADSFHFEFIDELNTYYKSKIPVDISIGNEPLYGRQIFSDYYHQKFCLHDGEQESIREPISDHTMLKKIKPAFNLGYCIYPLPSSQSLIRKISYALCRVNSFTILKPWFRYKHKQLIQLLSKKTDFSSKKMVVSARFRYAGYPESIAFQRKLFSQLLQENSASLTGIVPDKQYLQELTNSFVTLSPFGYGEVCFRDFETIMHGSLLLKPDMSHMKSFPNIYIPYETYIPLSWDGTDLLDKIDDILCRPQTYFRVVDRAREVYRTALSDIEKHTEEQFADIL